MILPEISLDPLYELTLRSSDEPDPTFTSSVAIEQGAAVVIRCTRDDSFESEDFVLRRLEEEIGIKDEKLKSITAHIPVYEPSHDGLYVCESKFRDDIYHTRQIRLSSKGIVPKDHMPCPDNKVDMCGNHGECAMQGGIPTCFCHTNYDGLHCEHYLITEFKSMSPVTSGVLFSESVIEVAAGASTTLNFTTIILTVLFFCLFLKERRKRRRMVAYFGEMPQRSNYRETPPLMVYRPPYVGTENEKNGLKSSEAQKPDHPGAMLQTGPPPAGSTSPRTLQRDSSLRKFRKAIRTRLPGGQDTSDSHLLESAVPSIS